MIYSPHNLLLKSWQKPILGNLDSYNTYDSDYITLRNNNHTRDLAKNITYEEGLDIIREFEYLSGKNKHILLTNDINLSSHKNVKLKEFKLNKRPVFISKNSFKRNHYFQCADCFIPIIEYKNLIFCGNIENDIINCYDLIVMDIIL